MDIFLDQLIQFYLNNTLNLRPLNYTNYLSCYARKKWRSYREHTLCDVISPSVYTSHRGNRCRPDRPLYLRNKLYDKTLKSQKYYSNILRFLVPWRSALWFYNTSWLDYNLSKRFLKQLTVSAKTTWFGRLFHMGITRLVKLNYLKS